MIRLATVDDSPALLKIYEQYIDTAITFEYNLPTVQEFAHRVGEILAVYPFLVWEEAGRVMGYAYAHRQKEREAYQWNAELSIYLDPSFVSKGAGKKLYRALMDLLKLQGVKTVYGVVTVPNEKSEKLHAAMGFHPAGIHYNTGYKSGAWRNVAWFEKQIAPYDADPQPILPLGQLSKEQVAAVLTGNTNTLHT